MAPGGAHAAGAPISPAGRERWEDPNPHDPTPRPLLGLPRQDPSFGGATWWAPPGPRGGKERRGAASHINPFR